MRQSIFQIFSLILAVAVAAVIVFIATVIIRGGMTFLFSLLVESLPKALGILLTDPVYIVALIVAVLLVWSYPWEQDGDHAPNPVRRGRQITHLPAANRYAAPTRRRLSTSSRARSQQSVAGRTSRIRRT